MLLVFAVYLPKENFMKLFLVPKIVKMISALYQALNAIQGGLETIALLRCVQTSVNQIKVCNCCLLMQFWIRWIKLRKTINVFSLFTNECTNQFSTHGVCQNGLCLCDDNFLWELIALLNNLINNALMINAKLIMSVLVNQVSQQYFLITRNA